MKIYAVVTMDRFGDAGPPRAIYDNFAAAEEHAKAEIKREWAEDIVEVVEYDLLNFAAQSEESGHRVVLQLVKEHPVAEFHGL